MEFCWPPLCRRRLHRPRLIQGYCLPAIFPIVPMKNTSAFFPPNPSIMVRGLFWSSDFPEQLAKPQAGRAGARLSHLRNRSISDRTDFYPDVIEWNEKSFSAARRTLPHHYRTNSTQELSVFFRMDDRLDVYTKIRVRAELCVCAKNVAAWLGFPTEELFMAISKPVTSL